MGGAGFQGRRASIVGWSALAITLCGVLVASSSAAAQTSMVPMRDGVRLATDVWGATGGPKNVVLQQTPYGRGAAAAAKTLNILFNDKDLITSWGVVYVIQDMRGTGGSEGGDTNRFLQDHQDTQDTLAWIKAQPWFGGKIMTYGLSATGTASILSIQNAPPELVCNVGVLSTGDVHDAFLPGGAWRKGLSDQWLPTNAGASIPAAWKAEEARSSFWADGIVDDAEITGTHVLTYYVAGQFDIFRDAPKLFQRLQARAANPGAHYLTLGAWTHNDLGVVGFQQGDVVLPTDSMYFPGNPVDPGVDMEKVVRHCLGSWPAPNFAPVRYYTFELADLGPSTGYWSSTTAWPPPGSTPVRRYLYERGLAGGPHATTSLWSAPVNPASPVPNYGGGELTAPAGPRLQGSLATRTDVITFVSPAADNRVILAGNLSAEIWASSDTTDIDVVVRVSEILKDGRTVLLTDGVRRGRYADSLETLEAMIPGTPKRFVVDLGALAFHLPVGHKLEVAIQGTSHPRYDLNPNQAVPLAENPTPIASGLTVFAGADFPSFVTFPVMSGTLPDTAVAPPPPPPGGGGGGTGTTSCGVHHGPEPLVALLLPLLVAGLARRRR